MGECKHKKLEPVNTYLGSYKPENIIETNYQCVECGRIFSQLEAKNKTALKGEHLNAGRL
jgi:hypothetical protein